MCKEAHVLIQQDLPHNLRHLQRLCQILGHYHWFQHKQPFLFYDIYEFLLF